MSEKEKPAHDHPMRALYDRCITDRPFREYVTTNTQKAFEEYGIKLPGVTTFRTIISKPGEYILVLPPLDDDGK